MSRGEARQHAQRLAAVLINRFLNEERHRPTSYGLGPLPSPTPEQIEAIRRELEHVAGRLWIDGSPPLLMAPAPAANQEGA